jgi:hypothetical protein
MRAPGAENGGTHDTDKTPDVIIVNPGISPEFKDGARRRVSKYFGGLCNDRL